MRYTTQQYGEVVNMLGQFNASDSDTDITVQLFNASTEAAITTSSNFAVQIGATGVFRYPSSLINTQPLVQTEILFIMTRTGGLADNRTHIGKIVLGGFTDNSASNLYDGAVTLDEGNLSGNAVPGTTYPTGTKAHPSDNPADARLIANREGLRAYDIVGAATLDANHLRWSFTGSTGPESDSINMGGFDVDGSGFERISVTGAMGGLPESPINGSECILASVTGLKGTWVTAQCTGTVVQATGGSTVQIDNALSPGLFGVTYNVNADGLNTQTCRMADVGGVWTFRNINTFATVGLVLKGASITLDASTSTGFGVLAMFGIHGAPLTLGGASLGLLEDFTIPGANWDQVLSAHLTAGTTGAKLNATTVAGASMALTAGAVDDIWNELLSGHTIAGSGGDALTQLLNGTVSRQAIDITTDPWELHTYIYRPGLATDTTIHEVYELFDQDGVAIAGNDAAGNNPLADSTRILAERRRV